MPHRQSLLDLLGRYSPLDDQDRACVERLAAFVRQEPHCFERHCPQGHITGSAWVVDPTGRRVLLTHHRKLNLWLQLGGHADGDSDVSAVALREAKEESGIEDLSPVGAGILDVDIHPIPARPGEPAHLHYDVRFAFRANRTDFRVSGESHSLEWVEIDRLQERTAELSMARMALKWKKWAAS